MIRIPCSTRRLLSVVVVPLLLAACDALDPAVCTSDLQVRITPDSATLAVGDTLTVRAEALGCGGTQRLEEEMRWSSEAPSIASVTPVPGLVTAIAPGEVRIVGDDLGPFGIGPVVIPITVTP
jgi:hypothetical protein